MRARIQGRAMELLRTHLMLDAGETGDHDVLFVAGGEYDPGGEWFYTHDAFNEIATLIEGDDTGSLSSDDHV